MGVRLLILKKSSGGTVIPRGTFIRESRVLKTKAFKMGEKCLLFHDFTNQRIWLYLIHSSLNIVLRTNLGEKLPKSPNKKIHSEYCKT